MTPEEEEFNGVYIDDVYVPSGLVSAIKGALEYKFAVVDGIKEYLNSEVLKQLQAETQRADKAEEMVVGLEQRVAALIETVCHKPPEFFASQAASAKAFRQKLCDEILKEFVTAFMRPPDNIMCHYNQKQFDYFFEKVKSVLKGE